MFSDTLTLTINAVDKTLNRINQDGYSSEYLLREDTGEFRLRIRNTKYTDKTRSISVDRHNVEFVHMVYGEVGSTPIVRKQYIVFENDAGDGLGTVADTVVALSSFVTEANVVKMLNWES